MLGTCPAGPSHSSPTPPSKSPTRLAAPARPDHPAPFGPGRLNRRRAAGELVDRLASSGVSPVELCDELLAPALRLIGEDWASGAATVADEHRATAICERLLARLPTRRTRVRGTVVVATPAGEHHALPAHMASIALRYDGWRVHHLSSDLPAEDLSAFMDRERPDLLVLSTTMPGNRTGAVARRAAESLGIPVMVGAAGRRLDELLSAARVTFSQT